MTTLHQTIQANGIGNVLAAINANLQKISTVTMPKDEAIQLNIALAKLLRIRLILADSKGKSPSDTIEAIAMEILPFTDGPAPAVSEPAVSEPAAPAESEPPEQETQPAEETAPSPEEVPLPTAGEE